MPGYINSEALIEYFGMSSNPAYDQQMAHKIFTYKEAGIDGIYLTESSFSGDWHWSLSAENGFPMCWLAMLAMDTPVAE